nr:MFS transporter [Ramlibacter aurantiacus]
MAGVVSAAHLAKLASVLPFVQGTFQLSYFELGVVVSTFNVIGAIGALMFGVAVDAMGHRRAVLAGLGLLLAGDLLGLASSTSLAFVLSRVIEGCGFVAVSTAAPSLITRLSAQRDRHRAIGIWSVYMALGSSLMLLAAGPVLNAFGWRTIWAIMGVVAASLMLGIRLWVPGVTVPPKAFLGWFGHLRASLWHPGLWLLAVTFACYTAMWFSVLTWLPMVTMHTAGIGVLGSAWLVALVIAVNIPGNVLGARLLQKGWPSGRLMLVGSSVMLLALGGIFGNSLGLGGKYLLCLVFSMVGGMLVPSFFSAAPDYASTPAHVGLVTGLLVQGSNVGQVIAPLLIGREFSSNEVFVAAAARPMYFFGAAAVACSLLLVLLSRSAVHAGSHAAR